MSSLARDLRKDLEKTVKQARSVAETGAQKVLEQHGVHQHEPYGPMSSEQRALRNRLRAHGRQLGDRRDPQKGTQTIGRLVQECAYEHWHRMLFARFLAETDLLIEPQSGVAITLEECQELARDEAADWLALASDYAERMLPQIFRKDDPILAITLPPETRSELEDLLKALPRDVFTADDSLGWVYQFWQADAKEAVNKSEKKIGADELPAVTQLFTEDYMVLFLLHNTLGAWWAGKVLAERPELATTAKSEDELRDACKVGDVEWSYLRFVRNEGEDGSEGPWRPAAGTFDDWPKAAKDITMLDPCMGSGHFLVFVLPILLALRTAEEGLTVEAAVEAVLRDNLFGLEIDPRCTQIAAFNLAFAAWRKVGYRALPQLNLACSGLAIGVTKAEWLKLAEKAVTAADSAAKRDLLGVEKNLLTVGLEERVKNGLEALYDLFAKAPWLGSLIDPRRAGADIFREGFDKLEPLLAAILTAADTDETREIAVAAQGMARAAELLALPFTLIATNPPFLGLERQEPALESYIKEFHDVAKRELALSFMNRARQFGSEGGVIATVLPSEWTFVRSQREFRKFILENSTINLIARLGPNSFATGIRAAPLLMISGSRGGSGTCCNIDVTQYPFAEKPQRLVKAIVSQAAQSDWLRQVDHRIVEVSPAILERTTNIGTIADARNGLSAGDASQFEALFWEVPKVGGVWDLLQSSPSTTGEFLGRSKIVRWENEDGVMARLAESVRHLNHSAQNWRRGKPLWGRVGLVVSQIGAKVSIYTGEKYDGSCFAIAPNESDNAAALICYGLDGALEAELKRINPTWNLKSPESLLQLSIDLEKWREVASQRYPNGIPLDVGTDPIQWTFSGRLTDAHEPLQCVVANSLGYYWPKQKAEAKYAESDGIICLTAIKGEPPATERLNALLADAFGADWSAAKLASLLTEAGYAGKSLDDWLRDGFFAQHCELFHQRPFIWHVWDGRRDGFHALVNYHRLAAANGEGRRTLEKLIYSYLGDWIDRQRADQIAGVEGADARLAHAEDLRGELIKILEGEPPYDIFVRWKPLHQQPIGWDPDINDGVRMNIRPFMTARHLGARAKTACILRATPKSLKWDKDRGKEPTREKENYPWFWGWDAEDGACAIDFSGGPKFDGIRWNEPHYTRAFKRAFKEAARVRPSAKVGDKV